MLGKCIHHRVYPIYSRTTVISPWPDFKLIFMCMFFTLSCEKKLHVIACQKALFGFAAKYASAAFCLAAGSEMAPDLSDELNPSPLLLLTQNSIGILLR